MREETYQETIEQLKRYYESKIVKLEESNSDKWFLPNDLPFDWKIAVHNKASSIWENKLLFMHKVDIVIDSFVCNGIVVKLPKNHICEHKDAYLTILPTRKWKSYYVADIGLLNNTYGYVKSFHSGGTSCLGDLTGQIKNKKIDAQFLDWLLHVFKEQMSVINPRSPMNRGYDKQSIETWIYVNNYIREIDGNRLCDKCNIKIKECDCNRCTYCKNKLEACECIICGNCDNRVDRLCINCEYCNGCCNCFHCDCGNTVDSDDVCNDCDRCLDCCTCHGDNNE